MPKKRGKTISVDFTGVEVGGAGKLLPEGPLQLEIEEIVEEVGGDSGKPYLAITFAVSEDGEYKGTKAWDNFSLQPQSLWKFRGLLEAAGQPTEDGPMEIDQDDLIGLIVVGEIIHEEYKGKTKHRINGYSAIEEETPAPAARPGATKKKPAADEPTWKVNQKVSFRDGKKSLVGKVTGIDGDDITVLVKGVSKDADGEYETKATDLEAA